MSSFAMILPRIVLVFVVIVQCVMSSVTNSTEEVEIKDPAKKVQPSFCPCLFDSRGFNCLTSKCTCSLASFGLNSTIFEAKEGRSSISSTALRPLLRRPLEHCKEADKIALFWRPLNNTFYYLIYHEVHSPPNHGLPYTFHETIPTRCGYEVLKDLTPNTLYSIELRSITLTNDGEIVTGRSPSLNRRTHPTYRVLNPVPRFYLKQWFLIENTYTALVGWNKDNDNGCFFYVVAFGSEDEDYQDFDIDNVWANRELNITQLQFGRNYSISISAIADIRSDDRREGPKEWLNITVPTCLQAYQNLQRCKPDPPENLTVVEKPVDSTDDELKLYNVSLYWNEPRFKPDFYAANLLIFDSNFTKFFLNISGENTHATFGNIQLTPEYEVHLIAYSIRGPSTAATIHRHFNGSVIVPFKSESVIPMELLLVVVVPLIVVILSALFTLNYCLGKRTRKQKREKYSKDLEEKAPSTITTISTISMPFVKNDEWEIGTTKLIIKDILGQGAFGVVRRGWYSNDNGQDTEVAIKMLRDNPTQEEFRQFYQEIGKK
ncbi:hypothetical protein JTB14_020835 [Gonioctena quinquepunctata]|nr:hypothetical protein JTB14_020835 [Gonioctena quinquepunctata]